MIKSRFPKSIKVGQQLTFLADGEWNEGYFQGITKGLGRRQYFFNFTTLSGESSRVNLFRLDIIRKVTG